MRKRRLLALLSGLVVALLSVVAALAAASSATAAPGPPDAPEWWFDSWQVEQLWSAGASGNGVVIAEVDTGVNASITELSGHILPGKDFGPAGGNGQIDRDKREFGHGTAMASIMVAQAGYFDVTGLARDARVLPIAVPIMGTTDQAAEDQIPKAIRWAADHGAKIISLSLGGIRLPSAVSEPCPTDEQDAISHAIGRGAIVVAAAGNDGKKGSPVEEPGVCLGVVSVGAVDRNGDVAATSSRHPYLTLSAPGVDVASLSKVQDSAYNGAGTSQATALTSAALALVWSKYPTLSNEQLLARVLATVDHRSSTRDPAYGYGTINPYRAITASVPANAPDPVYDAVAPFIAKQRAQLQPTPHPPVASVSPSPPGAFAVGPAPDELTSTVIWGIVLVVAGLVGGALLLIAAIRRNRRREAQAALVPVPTTPPPHDVVPLWHDILPPPDSPANTSTNGAAASRPVSQEP